jgi:S1-C subfamily serine protease
MAGPTFVRKTDRSGLTPLLVGGSPAYLRSDLLHQGLAERVGRETANLFAEPVASGDGISISWYAEGNGEPLALASLDPEKRRAPEAALSAQLATLAPLTGDPEVGPLLSAALYVASVNDILVIDGRPLITNWGLVPSSVAGRDPELRAHFAATLGRYASFQAPRVGDAAVAAARPAEPRPVTPASPAPEPAKPSIAARHPEWRAPLAAVAVAAALLLFLSWPHVLRSWYGSDYSSALKRARQLNDALSAKIAQIEKSLEDAVCVGGGLTGPKLPPADPEQVKPPPNATPPGVKAPSNLVESLNNSVVLVIAKVEKGAQLGSGFFIGPKTIVTNYHVAEGALKIWVINKMLASVTPVTLRANTPDTKGADFAVLEIDADGPSGPPLTLATVQDPRDILQEAVLAGYPGINGALDSAEKRLLDGDPTALPGMTVSHTSIEQLLLNENPALIEVNTPIRHGNSGGPLVDYCGRALGVNTFYLDHDGDRANYALAAKGLMAFLDSKSVPYAKSDEPCAPESTSAPRLPTGGAAR